ncbi:uncharacterized protein BXIN_1396 [Babesia sp. Xinjiang]|uniref:uncharacterized protein n=1 Tax=Babesia sp. Xinjiang TaxID=462227 RepID=UPI000A22D3B9|nr:uncharacterized protein BXIN_1396 [Babesia sp. Xinjiang]ORM39967.1 hypothetical protein BXIN_1396 [Babesia sp. Xinjiang]
MTTLEHLFEDMDRCLDEIESSKQRLSGAMSHFNTLYALYRLLRKEMKDLRKEVAQHLLIYDEHKSHINSISDELETLGVRSTALEGSLSSKSEVLDVKLSEMRTSQSKLEDILENLKKHQCQYNIGLLKMHEAEVMASTVKKGFKRISGRLTRLQGKLESRCLHHKTALSDLNAKTEEKDAEILSARSLLEAARAELSACGDRLSALEKEKKRLDDLLNDREFDRSSIFKEFDDLASVLSSCQNKLTELDGHIMESHESNKKYLQNIASLEQEEDRLDSLRGVVTSEAHELQMALEECKDHLDSLKRSLESISKDLDTDSTELEKYSTLRGELEQQLPALRKRANDWLKRLESAEQTFLGITTVELEVSELDAERSSIEAKMSEWQNKNETVQEELTRAQTAVNELEGSRSSLATAVDRETSRSQQLSKELEELNKASHFHPLDMRSGYHPIPYSPRRIEGEIRRVGSLQFVTMVLENRTNGSLGSQSYNSQRHMDEYKEKQSVKICDLKSALKSQREAVLQSKREECSNELQRHTAQLRSDLAELERSRQRKLDEDERIISQLQAELQKISNEMYRSYISKRSADAIMQEACSQYHRLLRKYRGYLSRHYLIGHLQHYTQTPDYWTFTVDNLVICMGQMAHHFGGRIHAAAIEDLSTTGAPAFVQSNETLINASAAFCYPGCVKIKAVYEDSGYM